MRTDPQSPASPDGRHTSDSSYDQLGSPDSQSSWGSERLFASSPSTPRLTPVFDLLGALPIPEGNLPFWHIPPVSNGIFRLDDPSLSTQLSPDATLLAHVNGQDFQFEQFPSVEELDDSLRFFGKASWVFGVAERDRHFLVKALEKHCPGATIEWTSIPKDHFVDPDDTSFIKYWDTSSSTRPSEAGTFMHCWLTRCRTITSHFRAASSLLQPTTLQT